MPLLTPQLLFQIKEIIRKRHTAFIANVFGHDAVAPAVLEDLKKQGLIDKGETSVEDAYLYGQVVAHLEDPQVASMTAEQVKAHVAKNPVALTPAELAAKKAATLSAATYVVGLGNVVEKETGQLLIEADHALRAKLKADIADETAVSVAMRKTVKELKSDLGHRTQDWTRGLDRIAITEKHNAMQAGVAHGFQKQFGDPRVAIRPMPDACADCRRLHLGPDGHPRIFKLSQLAPPGANVKKPKSAWVPCLGAVHPHCQCQLVRVPAGWGFNKDSSLVPGGEFGVEHDETEKSFTRVVLEEEDHLDRLQKAHRLAGRMEYDGLLIAIEQEAGDVREWRDRNGETGTTTMLWPYGFIEGTKGADGEAIDVYVGPNPNAEKVYVVDQRKKLGEGKFGGFDEQKVMLGFSSQAEARDAYLAHYNDPGFLGAIREMDFDDFKNRVSKDTKEVVLKSAVPAVQEQFVVHADGTSFEKVFPDVLEKAGPHKYLTKVFSHGHWIYTYADEQGGKVVDHHSDPDQGALKLPKDKAHELEAFRAKHNLPGKVIVGQQYAILPVHKDAFQNTVAQPQLTIPAPATAVRKKYTSLQLADLPAGTKLRGFYGEKGFVYEKVVGGWVPASNPTAEPMGSVGFSKLVPDGFEPVVEEKVPEVAVAQEAQAVAEAVAVVEAVPVAEQIPETPPADEPTAEEETPTEDTTDVDGGAKTEEQQLSKQKAWAVGEHIFGSVKDKVDAAKLVQDGKLGELSNEMAALVVNKASLMPAYDAATMQSLGATPGGAHLALQMAALVAPKPSEDSKEARDAYARGVKLVAASIQKIRNPADAKDVVDSLKMLASTGVVEHVFEDMGHVSSTQAHAKQAELEATAPPGTTIHVYHQYENGKSYYVVARRDDAVKKSILALGQRFVTQLGIGSYSKGKFHSTGPWSQPGKIWWDALKLAKEADAKGDDGWAHIGAKLAAKKATTAAKKEAEPKFKWRPTVSDQPDLAGTKVKIETADKERFASTFGFKGVQRGESLPDKDLDHHLKHAEMAFHDLADVLGVDPKLISLNGRLGIAFGARGKGGARAHYEPVTKAINLTRFAGAGSLAHEWGHFLDNIVAQTNFQNMKEGEINVFATAKPSRLPPGPLQDAVKGVLSAIHDHPDAATRKAKHAAARESLKKQLDDSKAAYYAKLKEANGHAVGTPERAAKKADADKLMDEHNALVGKYNALNFASPGASNFVTDAIAFDGGDVGKYMSETEELFARAFESFVQDKIEDSGRRNSYLVDGTKNLYDTPYANKALGTEGQPYPRGEERKRINAAFEKLIDVLKKEGHLHKAMTRAADDFQKAEKYGVIAPEDDVFGGAVMLEADAPGQPVQFPDPAGYRAFLLDPSSMKTDNVMLRDPATYMRAGEGERESYVYTFDVKPTVSDEERSDIVAHVREDVEGYAERNHDPLILPMESSLTDGNTLTKGRTRTAVVFQKSGPHKYTAKTWHDGHWVYEYAAEHGGKVVPHVTDPTQLVVKMPKTDTGGHALNKLKGKLNLSTGAFEGKQNFILPVKQSELPAANPFQKPAAKPSGTKPASQQGAGATHSGAPTAPKAGAVLDDVPTISKHTLSASPKAGWQLQAGTVGTFQGQQGVVKGWDYRGRMVLDVGGQRRIANFDQLAGIVKGEHRASFQKLAHPNAVRAPTAQQRQLVKTVLAQSVGGAPAKQYADWLHDRGHEVYLVGGIVRDMLVGTDPKKPKTEKQILAAMNDVDFVSSAPPDTLRKAYGAVGMVAPDTPLDFQMKGCVSNKMLDAASLSSGGVYQSPTYHVDTQEHAKPSTFDHDLDKDAGRRDFTANALYYDVHNEAIIDPTGTGVEDARNRVLRRPPGAEWSTNDKLAMRFWKFRVRGWTGEAGTTKEILALADKELSAMSYDKRARYIAKQLGKESGSAKTILAKLEKVMTDDGAGHLYAKHVKPLEALITKGIQKAKSKG